MWHVFQSNFFSKTKNWNPCNNTVLYDSKRFFPEIVPLKERRVRCSCCILCILKITLWNYKGCGIQIVWIFGIANANFYVHIISDTNHYLLLLITFLANSYRNEDTIHGYLKNNLWTYSWWKNRHVKKWQVGQAEYKYK